MPSKKKAINKESDSEEESYEEEVPEIKKDKK
jgi:hypothetical protein